MSDSSMNDNLHQMKFAIFNPGITHSEQERELDNAGEAII
jgi:hypothetical protein